VRICLDHNQINGQSNGHCYEYFVPTYGHATNSTRLILGANQASLFRIRFQDGEIYLVAILADFFRKSLSPLPFPTS